MPSWILFKQDCELDSILLGICTGGKSTVYEQGSYGGGHSQASPFLCLLEMIITEWVVIQLECE